MIINPIRLLINLPMTAQIIVAIILGTVVGMICGPIDIPIELIGKSIINLVKLLAVPMVFFAVLEIMIGVAYSGKDFRRLIVIAGINAFFAASIGLLLSNYFRPGDPVFASGITNNLSKPIGLANVSTENFIKTFIPDSILSPFVENQMIATVLLAILLGLAIRHTLKTHTDYSTQSIAKAAGFITQVFVLALQWVITLIPIAVFVVITKTVSEHGVSTFGALWMYVAVGVGGLILHSIIIYPTWIILKSNISIKTFFRSAFEPCMHAFGMNSSLAALPTTLKKLDELGVSKHSSRLGACVGTNLNNDGILLYEAMAVIFVAQAFGLQLTIVEQLVVAFVCVLTALGTAGIPESGIVSLSLILSVFHLPVEIIPILLSVDWIVARVRSIVNVLSDMTVSIALDGTSGGADSQSTSYRVL
jgi:Na+/H+-dicarboxylate symporter